MNNRPIILHGNNFDSNRGCQALRFCTSRILERYLPEMPELHANIFCNENLMYREESGNELNQLYEVKKERNLPFYLWGTNIVGCKLWGLPAPMKVISKMKRLRKENATGILLALGGDNWSMDYGNLALHLFTAPFAAAAGMGFPTCVWGASIGPFSQNPALERKMAKLLQKIDLITVREPLTVEYLRSLGVTKNVRRVCDPAFLLPAIEPENLSSEIRAALDEGAVGINLAPLFKRYARQTKSEFSNRVRATFLHFLETIDVPVVMIPHVMMEPEVFPDNDDFLFMQSLRDSLPDGLRERVFLYDSRNDDCRKIKWVISRCRAFAGCRTHSTIAALSTGVPTLCIGYSVKSRGLNQDIFGHERWVDHFSELLGTSLAERFSELLENESEIRSQLKEAIPRCVGLAWENGRFLRELAVEKGLVE